ncbi:exopolysaccharide biosynthesis protein [Azotobacter salinestris]|uniref:exopolysaccharide biosynthesis protein n=1 Tax=Azotobacter salinestris TaxID=69964 RepID=UPI0032DEC883
MLSPLRLNAQLCILSACGMPALELIPFGNSTAGAALSVTGPGMMVRNGLMVLGAIAFFVASLWRVSRIILQQRSTERSDQLQNRRIH